MKQITMIEIETRVRIGFSIWKCRTFPLTGVLTHHGRQEKHQLEQDLSGLASLTLPVNVVILGSPKNESKIGRTVEDLFSARGTESSCNGEGKNVACGQL